MTGFQIAGFQLASMTGTCDAPFGSKYAMLLKDMPAVQPTKVEGDSASSMSLIK